MGVAGPDLASINWSSESEVSSLRLLARTSLQSVSVAKGADQGVVLGPQTRPGQPHGVNVSSSSLP